MSHTYGSMIRTRAIVPAEAMAAKAAKTRMWPTLRISGGVKMQDNAKPAK